MFGSVSGLARDFSFTAAAGKATDSAPGYRAQDKGRPKMDHSVAVEWVKQDIKRGRGRELQGTYNPLLIGELFWKQSSCWEGMAEEHLEAIHDKRSDFLRDLLETICPDDIQDRVWTTLIQEKLKLRSTTAKDELSKLVQNLKGYPINYNHSYTDTVKKRRTDRIEPSRNASQDIVFPPGKETDRSILSQNRQATPPEIDPDMENHSCKEGLDNLSAVYKVQLENFVANVTTQVIERHIVSELEKIFSPIAVSPMSDPDLEALSSEPPSVRRQRAFLDDRVSKLGAGHEILRMVMRNAPI